MKTLHVYFSPTKLHCAIAIQCDTPVHKPIVAEIFDLSVQDYSKMLILKREDKFITLSTKERLSMLVFERLMNNLTAMTAEKNCEN